jgi:SAM-dependent methyltransferase
VTVENDVVAILDRSNAQQRRSRRVLDAGTISNDLAGWIAADLPGLDAVTFERAFVEVVESVDPTWKAFYRNTLAALATGGEPGATIHEMAPVHERAAALAVGPRVVELGCCFGFLAPRLAADGHDVTAVDLCPGTVGLLGSVAPALGVPLSVVAGDATRVPLATGSADTVFAGHLLEHLPAAPAPRVLADMLRVDGGRGTVERLR